MRPLDVKDLKKTFEISLQIWSVEAQCPLSKQSGEVTGENVQLIIISVM